MPGRSFGYHTNIGKKRARNEDEYFEEEDEEDNMAYQPAPGSPGEEKNEESEEEDPLDAFMADIETEVKCQQPKESTIKEKPKEKKKRQRRS